jgi:hypothetical protein
MSPLKWMSPFSSLVISSRIHELICKKKLGLKIIPPIDANVKSYLDRIGFPQGKECIHCTSFPIRHFNDNPSKNCSPLFDFIQDTFPQQLRGNCVKYLISELVDNIDQHSSFTSASVMAQYFPNKDFVDIGVVDNGISIPGIFENHNIHFSNDSEAISNAINGVSTKKEEGRGFGLSSSSRIAVEALNGDCYFISRRGIVHIDSKGFRKLYKLQNQVFRGTIVYFRFKAPKNKIDILPYLQK